MKTALCILLSILTASPAFAIPNCAQPDLNAATQRVKTIQAQLLTYRLNGEMDEEVPARLQEQIRRFKDALASLADAAMQCEGDSAGVKPIEIRLARLLDANKPIKQEVYDPKKPPQLDHIYGDAINIKVTEPANAPLLRLFEFNFGIACGEDSILLVYEFGGSNWRQFLRWQSDNYDQVSGAFGDYFQYQVVTRPGASDWLLATFHGMPWCTSNMSAFDVDLLRPGGPGIKPLTLMHREETYRRDDDPVLKLTPGGFQVKVTTDDLDLGNVMSRPAIYRFRVDGANATRIQPIAMNGRDFVDEWLQAPWSEAKEWIDPTASVNLESAHKRIESLRDPKAKDWPSWDYGPVRRCSGSSAHFQVELDEGWFEEKQKDFRPDQPTFFLIQEGNNSFTMLSASSKSDPRCTGGDIMTKH